MESAVLANPPELCDTVTIDMAKEENVNNASSTVHHGSSFVFGAGSTIQDESQPIYVVLNPTAAVQQTFGGSAHCKSNNSLQQAQTDISNGNIVSQSEVVPEVDEVPDEDGKPIPGRTRTGVTKCLEPGCKFVCTRIPQLRSHLEDVHGILQERKIFSFNNEEDFKEWQSALEREARCTYMRRRGWQLNKNGSTTSCFYCHRGGAYTSKATKKQMKMQGSCKTGFECTSSMKVTMWSWPDQSGKQERQLVRHVKVEAYLQHYGHNLDLSHTRITKVEKADIARKLNNGISRHKILDEIRGTLDASVTPHRVHLLSLQDLYNIEKKEGILSKKKCGNDAGTTVQAWIEKMQASEDNPVLLIKYQQEKPTSVCSCLSDDDFILVLQTPLQSMMLRKYGPHQSICLDITQGEQQNTFATRSDPSFYLMSVEVIIPLPSGQNEVFPVAWFVSNRKDRAVIEICLSEIKNNLSELTITPSYLMIPSVGVTLNCDWFDVWTKIFGPGPRKMLCGWHIMSEWKQRVQRITQPHNIRNTPLETTRLLTNLMMVIQESSVAGFVPLQQEFLNDLSRSEVTMPYAQYFRDNYSAQPEAWARAYRPGAAIGAEASFEEYHKRISRNIYHEGFKRKQLDVLIKTLMRNSRDKALNKLRQCYKLSSDVTIKRMTSSNHWDSVILPTSFVTPHKDDSHTWSVMSVIGQVRAVEQPTEEGEPFKLKQVAVEYIVKCSDVDTCPARLMCAYRCDDCAVCSHHFVCTCQSDQNVNPISGGGLHVLCEHCHLVCRYMQTNSQSIESLFSAPPETITENIQHPANDNKTDKIISDKLSECSPEGDKLIIMVVSDEHDYFANNQTLRKNDLDQLHNNHCGKSSHLCIESTLQHTDDVVLQMTEVPSSQPINEPSSQPIDEPSSQPIDEPSSQPINEPSSKPINEPSSQPIDEPLSQPIDEPSSQPIDEPSSQPIDEPSSQQIDERSPQPVDEPHLQHIYQPNSQPCIVDIPPLQPTDKQPSLPNDKPLTQPTDEPHTQPTDEPHTQPTDEPHTQPTDEPSTQPTDEPHTQPMDEPHTQPTDEPSTQPTDEPSTQPTDEPPNQPTDEPPSQPYDKQFFQPNDEPSLQTNNDGTPVSTGVLDNSISREEIIASPEQNLPHNVEAGVNSPTNSRRRSGRNRVLNKKCKEYLASLRSNAKSKRKLTGEDTVVKDSLKHARKTRTLNPQSQSKQMHRQSTRKTSKKVKSV